jgi:hypothetical protein
MRRGRLASTDAVIPSRAKPRMTRSRLRFAFTSHNRSASPDFQFWTHRILILSREAFIISRHMRTRRWCGRAIVTGKRLGQVLTVLTAGSPDAAGGPDSIAPMQCRWCLQKEISASAIQRGHRKTARWLYICAVKKRIRFFRN